MQVRDRAGLKPSMPIPSPMSWPPNRPYHRALNAGVSRAGLRQQLAFNSRKASPKRSLQPLIRVAGHGAEREIALLLLPMVAS